MDIEEFKSKYELKPVIENKNLTPKNPLVSVCVQTYQHVNYIKECLEGILMQETDFPFEILLGEDMSSDGTREICQEYADKYPEKIRLFLHHRENNIKIDGRPTGRFNFMYNLYHANGKYIAICEGDDYWTDPLKLQKQVDFLEANNEYSMCFHKAKIVLSGVKVPTNIYDHLREKEYTGEEILNQWTVPTASVLFRNVFDLKVLEQPNKGLLFGDILLFLLLASHGKLFCLQEEMSVYRRNEQGISVLGKFNSLDKLNHYKALHQYLKPNFEYVIKNFIAKYLVKVIHQYLDKHQYIEALKFSVELSILAPTIFKNKVLKKRIKNILNYT